jgi:hypothetical protein
MKRQLNVVAFAILAMLGSRGPACRAMFSKSTLVCGVPVPDHAIDQKPFVRLTIFKWFSEVSTRSLVGLLVWTNLRGVVTKGICRMLLRTLLIATPEQTPLVSRSTLVATRYSSLRPSP